MNEDEWDTLAVLDNYVCSMGWKLIALGWVAAAVAGILTAEVIDRLVNGIK